MKEVCSMSEMKCCIHINKVPNSLPVRIFTETTLAECRAISNFARIHNFKHKNIALPESVNKVDGYHVSCFRSFTAISMTNVNQGTESNDEGIPIDNVYLSIADIILNQMPFSNLIYNISTVLKYYNYYNIFAKII